MSFILANFILAITPPTRWFSLKRFLLRLLGIEIGSGSNICGDVRFYGGGKISIGSDCWIGIGSRFYTSIDADVAIGDNCDIAPLVVFMCGTHEIGGAERRAGPGFAKPIDVKSGCWIGIGSTLLGGCSIGGGSIVAARSLMLGKVYPANSLFAGSPSVVKRELEVAPQDAA